MTDHQPNATAVFPVRRATATLALAVVIVAGGIYLTLTLLDAPTHARLNLIAAAVCGGAGLVGLLPVWALSRTHQHGAAYGFMIGILLRMVVAGGAVGLAQWGLKLPDAQALSLWIAGWYLIVLAVEVKLVSSHVLATYGPAPGARPGVAMESES